MSTHALFQSGIRRSHPLVWLFVIVGYVFILTNASTAHTQTQPATQTANQPKTTDWVVAAGGSQQFDVASIRQSKFSGNAQSNIPLGPGDTYVSTGGFFKATNLPLITYIAFAYKIMGSQTQYALAQFPKWVSENTFDIEARVDGNPTKDQMRLMVRSLLEERFKLKIHTETRQVNVFALEFVNPGLTGPMLRRHSTDDSKCSQTLSDRPSSDSPSSSHPAISDAFPDVCGGIFQLVPSAPEHLRIGARNVDMQLIAKSLPSRELNRPVIDQTGAGGKFDFSLEWSPDRVTAQGADAIPDTSGPGLMQAMKEQLGLKLIATKTPMDVLVVDHIEMPSEN